MKKMKKLWALGLLSLFFANHSLRSSESRVETNFDKAEWEKLNDKDGIRVFRWSPPNSDLFAFKAEGVVDAPVGKVGSIIIDVSREKEWVPDLGDAKTIREVSRAERIDYAHIKTPFIIKDRDFVYDGKGEYDPKARRMVFKFASVEDSMAPPTSKVRGVIHASHYTIWPTEDGKKTNMIFVVHIDPKGTVPRWIVNLFQTGYPREMFESIRRQAAKNDVTEDERIKKHFVEPNLTQTENPEKPVSRNP